MVKLLQREEVGVLLLLLFQLLNKKKKKLGSTTLACFLEQKWRITLSPFARDTKNRPTLYWVCKLHGKWHRIRWKPHKKESWEFYIFKKQRELWKSFKSREKTTVYLNTELGLLNSQRMKNMQIGNHSKDQEKGYSVTKNKNKIK